MICSSCHHERPPVAFISLKRVGPCSTCDYCRAAVAATRERRNAGKVRRYEVAYFRRDKEGLACLDCPILDGCVFETGAPVELCPLFEG